MTIPILTLDGWTVTQEHTDTIIRQIARHSSGRQYDRTLSETPVDVLTWLQLVQRADQSLQPLEQEALRRAVRVLAMLGELHKMGFQRLRFNTQDKGIGLRLLIGSADQFSRLHGAELTQDQGTAYYSSNMENRYFNWPDATTDTARQLAAKFIVRFPELAERGRGLDWAYAGWYQHMLGLAEQGYFPIVWPDWPVINDDTHIYLMNAPATVKLLKPPAGGSESTIYGG